jgi:hypothetical protein
MQFHESCLNVDNNTCFGCIGNLDQNDIQQTKVLSIDIDQTVEHIRTKKSQQRLYTFDLGFWFFSVIVSLIATSFNFSCSSFFSQSLFKLT